MKTIIMSLYRHTKYEVDFYWYAAIGARKKKKTEHISYRGLLGVSFQYEVLLIHRILIDISFVGSQKCTHTLLFSGVSIFLHPSIRY